MEIYTFVVRCDFTYLFFTVYSMYDDIVHSTNYTKQNTILQPCNV